MSSLCFSKYHGNGNDFILVDDRKKRFARENKKLIQTLCHRNLGVGADGIILFQLSQSNDAKMVILNSDGSTAESCGNGLSCLLRFMWDIGYKKERYCIEIEKGIVLGKVCDNKAVLEIEDPIIHGIDIPISFGDKKIECCYVNSGVPHAVCFVKNISSIDVENTGKQIRSHEYFHPSGTNVNFAEFDGKNNVKVRTYERGVEKETCSCGTGAIAVAIATSCKFNISSPISVKFKYGEMVVSFIKNQGQISKVKLNNTVNFVYSGVLPLK